MTCLDATIRHEGNPPFFQVARIDHELKDGCHVFTSEKIPGLLVMSQSKEAAIKQLPAVIATLFKRNKGVDCQVFLGADGEDKKDPDYAIIQKAA